MDERKTMSALQKCHLASERRHGSESPGRARRRMGEAGNAVGVLRYAMSCDQTSDPARNPTKGKAEAKKKGKGGRARNGTRKARWARWKVAEVATTRMCVVCWSAGLLACLPACLLASNTEDSRTSLFGLQPSLLSVQVQTACKSRPCRPSRPSGPSKPSQGGKSTKGTRTELGFAVRPILDFAGSPDCGRHWSLAFHPQRSCCFSVLFENLNLVRTL